MEGRCFTDAVRPLFYQFPDFRLDLRRQDLGSGADGQRRQGAEFPQDLLEGFQGVSGEEGSPVRREIDGGGKTGIPSDGAFRGKGHSSQAEAEEQSFYC